MRKVIITVLILSSALLLAYPTYSTEIVDVSWHSNEKIIHVKLDSFPSTWGNWTIYVNNKEVPTEGGPGNPVIRPDAPLDHPPTGLIVGTKPWVTGLGEVDFPCCGTIQLDIPGVGVTNEFRYNLVDQGCETTSKRECPSEWVTNYGDLIIEGTETKTIEETKFFQHGNIYVKDQAKLVVKNSQLKIGRGQVPTVHVHIFVAPGASLDIENSKIFPEPTGLTLVVLDTEGRVNIRNSPTEIHLLSVHGESQVKIVDSEVVSPIGGLIQVSGGDTKVINSTIGSVLIDIPANSEGKINGLKSGMYLESWNIHQDLGVSNIPYNLTFEKVHVLKDNLPPGPYERGWIFYINPEAKVKITNSELRKLFIPFKSKKISLKDLKINTPVDLKYKDIELENVTIKGQWGIDLTNSDLEEVTIKNSDFLFVQISGHPTLKLIDSDIVEFIPRNFFGTVNYSNCTWHNAGEIIGDTSYHSMGNHFTMKGSLSISSELEDHLQWHKAQVKRIFGIQVLSDTGQPIDGASIKIAGKTYETNEKGETSFPLVFTESDYFKPREVKVTKKDQTIAACKIDFFTDTPIKIPDTGFTCTEKPEKVANLRGWQFHDDDMNYLRKMIDLAPEYNINHIELSHNMIWYTEDVLNNESKQKNFNKLIERAHKNNLELFIWTHEISTLPEKFIVNGKTDLDNPKLWEWLKDKYRTLFQVIPGVDGMVLTLSETKIKVYEDSKVITTLSKSERVAKLLRTIYEVCKEYNKTLYVRTWAAVEWITEGIKMTPKEIGVMNKVTQSDFGTYWPHHPNIGIYGDRPQVVEFDLCGQYLGRSQIPSAKPAYIKYRWRYAFGKGVIGAIGRVGTLEQNFSGKMGNLQIENTHVIGTPNEINLYAFSKILANPDIDIDKIWEEWAGKKYGSDAVPYIISAYKRTFDIARQLYREAGEVNAQLDKERVVLTTHSAVPWWGILDADRPEGRFWKKIEDDYIFKHVQDNGDLTKKIQESFDPIIEMCKKSLKDLKGAKTYLKEKDYLYLRSYLEKELVVIKVFKQIKKVMIRFAMAEKSEGLRKRENKELLNKASQDLLVLADHIEKKFGSDQWPAKPAYIRKFIQGIPDI